MAEKEKNNNLLYSLLTCVGLLLVLIPFLLFDIGGSSTILTHIGRFGLHILAFGSAIVAGSVASAAVTKVGSSAITMKVAAISTSVVIAGGITYNVVQTQKKEQPIAENSFRDSTSIVLDSSLALKDTTANISDSSIAIAQNTTEINPAESKDKNNDPIEVNSNNSSKVKTDPKNKPTNKTKEKNEVVVVNPVPEEKCKAIKIGHGSGALDLTLGLSIFDPNKLIRLDNSCGAKLKGTKISLRRAKRLIESKIVDGNEIDWKAFKTILNGDKIEVEITQAYFKDAKGKEYLYTFPKSILTLIPVSNHMQFEGADKIKKTTKKYVPTEDEPIPTNKSTKDKVEEEMNKYGN